MTHKGNTSIIIQMKVFDDHITLWNGGTLPPGYTVERILGRSNGFECVGIINPSLTRVSNLG